MTEEEKEYPRADQMFKKKFLDDISSDEKVDQIPGIQTLGKFKMLQRIGKGAAADVFLAEDTSINRRVALKVLTRFHPQDFERFKRESKVAAKLNHPSIVQLYEVGELQGCNYISMQYIEGGSAQDKNLTLVQALKVISTIARAVEYAHNQGVIHRDIKPANILVDHEGKCYLADFGIAKSLTLQSIGKTLSVTGMIIGTPNFMSPEQARGDITKVDFLSDVYSLGATLYYLLTGKEPYQGTSVMEIINKVINEEAPAPRSIKKDIPAEVEAIVLKAIEKDKQKRYQRAVDLAKDIERFLRGEPVSAKVTSLTGTIRKRLKKYKASITIIGIMILALILYLWIATVIRERNFLDYKTIADNHFAKGELDKALQYYTKCLAIKDDQQIQSRINEINNRRQSLSEAQKILSNALALYDRYKKNLYDKSARIKEINGLKSEIISLLGESIKKCPTATAHYYRGKIYREWLDFDNAEKDLTSAIELDKNFDLARLERIKLYWDIYTSRPFYGSTGTAALKTQSSHKTTVEKVMSEYEKINPANLPEFEVQIIGTIFQLNDFIALKYEGKEKDYQKTLRNLEQAYEISREEEFYYLAGRLCYIMRDYDRTVMYMKMAIDRRPVFPKALILEANALSFLGKFQEAIEDCTKAIEQVPDYHPAYLERALHYLDLEQYERAEEDCGHLLEVGASGYDSISYEILGIISSRKGLFDKAMEYHNKSLIVDPRNASALVNRSIIYKNRNEIEKALDDLNEAIGIDAKELKAYYQRGIVYLFHTRQLELALDDFNMVIDLSSSYRNGFNKLANIFLYRGIIYFNFGQYEPALKDFNEAIRLDPSLEKEAGQFLDEIKKQK